MKTLLTIISLCTLCFVAIACNSAKLESSRIVQDGIKQYEAKHLDKALVTFKNAVSRDPNNDLAYEYMAKIEQDYHNYNGAVQYLEMAAGIYDDPRYWVMMGNAHLTYGLELLAASKQNEAFLALGKCTSEMGRALKMDPHYAEASLGMARCYEGMNRHDDAVKSYERSIRSNPTLKDNGVTAHYRELGKLYQQFGFFQDAQDVLNNGLFNNPDDGQLETTLADVMYDLNQYDVALAHYNTAIQSLSRMGKGQTSQLDAYYGAGMASFGLAKTLSQSQKNQEASAKYLQAKSFLEQYIDMAVGDALSVKRADAVERIKEIENHLENLAAL